MPVTIDDKFRKDIESGIGCAVILAGSDSDVPHIDKVSKGLAEYGVPHQIRIASAHKQPLLLMELIGAYDAIQGPLAYIAIAGGTDALSGTVSFHSSRPVVSCPPDAPNASCLTNPPGSSNAYVANANNAARFVAQMFAWHTPSYRNLIEKKNEKKIAGLLAADEHFRTQGITDEDRAKYGGKK